MHTLGRMLRLKWLIPVWVALMLAVMVPVAYAWVDWSEPDPIFNVTKNGVTNQFKVVYSVPSQYCSSIESIETDVKVPKGASVTLVDQQGPCGILEVLETQFDDGGNHVQVKGKVKASADFPVQMKIYCQGQLKATYDGNSNHKINAQPISFPC